MVNQIAAAGSKLATMSMLDELVPAVPGLGTDPAMLLGLHEALAPLAMMPPIPDEDALISYLTGVAAGGYEYGNVAVVVNGDVTTVSLELATPAGTPRTADAPLAISTDEVQLLSDALTVDVTMPTTTIAFEYDASIADPAQAFALTVLPSFDVSMSLNESVNESVLFGFAEATATGTAKLDVGVSLSVVDPDANGRLTGAELATLDIADAVTFAPLADGLDDVDIDLSLDADVFGTHFTGELDVTDASIFADPTADISVAASGTNPIDLLTNFGAEASITALTQLVSGFGAAMIGGDVDLPFISDGVFLPGDFGDLGDDFDEVFAVIQPLLDYVNPRAAGQIVCGTLSTSPDGGTTDGVPFGQTSFLETGDTVECRVYTSGAVDPGTVTWSVTSGNATVATNGSGAAADPTAGAAPTKNATFTMTGDGSFEVEVALTPTGDSPITIVERPDSIQELLLELLDAGLIPDAGGGVPEYTYEPNLQAISFPIGTTVAGPINRSVEVNMGSELVAETGLTGMQAPAGGASANMSIAGIEAGVTLGLILADDVATINPTDNATYPPGPGDRFFVRGTDELISVDEVSFTGDLDMVGRLGFIDVTAALTASLAKEAGVTDPAVSVGLGAPTGLTVGAANDPSATLVADLLRGGPGGFGLDTNLVLSGVLEVEGNVLSGGVTASGNIGIEWNLDDPEPTLTISTDFQNNLFPFDTAEELTYTGPNEGAPGFEESLFVASAGGLMAQAGLVGSTLVDPATNETCTIVAVVSDTSLQCENPSNGGTDVNPISFTNGTVYDVTGNTLAYLAEILAAIEGLASYLEAAMGEAAFAEQIPIIGISPNELVGHVEELRNMVDEFRGVQDGQIVCDVTAPDPAADMRAIPSADGNATLDCQVIATVSAPSDIRWRVIEYKDAGPDEIGPWVDGPDTVGISPTASATLSLTGADVLGTNSSDPDGYISLGEEYAIEAEWTDNGELQSAALPPRTPQSLQQLDDKVSEILGLPDDVLEFELVNAPADPTLRINLGYGICSDQAPTAGGVDCSAAAEGPTPEANLNFDLGGSLPSFVALETSGTLDVRYAALGQFDIGVPLDGDTPFLYGTTGLDLVVEVNGQDLGIMASVGPATATLGNGAGELVGTADNDDDDGGADDNTLVDNAEDLSGVPDGSLVDNTTTTETCIAQNATTTTIDCTLSGGVWSNGDGYKIGDRGEFQAALQFELNVADGGGALLPTETVEITSAQVEITDFADLGAADCGPIGTVNTTENIVFGSDDGDDQLSGIACARLSMELALGSGQTYLGELAFDWDGADFAVYVPADLAARLLDAVLDPAFLLRALPEVLQEIEDGLRSAASGDLPSAISDPLHVGADGIKVVREGVELALDTFSDEIDLLSNIDELETAVEDKLTELLSSDAVPITVTVETECFDDGGTDCTGRPIQDLVDIKATFTMGDEYSAGTGVNLGLDGLPIGFEAGLEGFANWSATFTIGVSRNDGPYIELADPDDGAELALEAGVRFTNDGATDCDDGLAASVEPGDYDATKCMKGRLVFLFIEALDRTNANGGVPSNVTATLGLDVTSTDDTPGSPTKVTLGDIVSGELGIAPVLEGSIHLDLHIRTGIETPWTQSADLPTVLGTLHLDWAADLGGVTTPFSVSFDDLHIDLGTFLSEFINPITREIKKITGPLQPIVDTLMAPIPVVSDLAELVGADPITMISLLEAVSGADLSLVRAIAAFISFINNLPTDGNFQIPLGGLDGGSDGDYQTRSAGQFDVNVAAAKNTVSSQNAGALVGPSDPGKAGSDFTKDMAKKGGLSSDTQADGRPATFGVPGLSFPFLEDSSQIFGLLVGRDATLIRWDAGTLEATAGFSYDFGPIMAGPVPITITIGGEIGVRGRFAIGYDTYGIRQLLDGGSGVALFDGIFIDDLDSNGNDVPEIEFFGRVFAGASVDLVIVSAGVRGGIELTFSLDLDDRPDPDGKLRIEEIVNKLANPICLFTVSGKIEAFLEVFVEIDLFFYSEEFSFELVRITLLEWSSACEPPSPELAVQDGDVLYLNVGSRRGNRNIQEDQINESIEVRQIKPGKVRVSGFGWEEVHEGVGLIVADGGAGADELKFLAGTLEGTTETPQPWTIPVVVSGGPGNDIVKIEGNTADHIFGDATIGAGSWLGKAYNAITAEAPDADDGDNKDNVNAGGGDDLIELGAGNDVADGQEGRDTVLGGDGDDDIDGGPGDDVVDGQNGNDTVQGGPIKQPAPGADADDDDVLIGGANRDVLSGDFGNDLVFGDAVGGAATAGLNGGSDGRLQRKSTISLSDFDGWCAAPAAGTDGDDILTGTDGDDILVGGGGIDSIDGGKGNDWECGGAGNDTVIGGPDNDILRGDGDDDSLEGNDGNDIINGGGGTDVAHGNSGDDDIFGDAGSDLLYGDDGNDIVVGDTGSIGQPHSSGVDDGLGHVSSSKVLALDANLTVDSTSSGARRVDCEVASATGASDCVFGGNGSDALFGGSDGDIVRGEAGVDLLEGNDGPDDLRGGTENDLLLGSAGTDLIYGDSGDDQAFGDRSITEWSTNTPSSGDADEIYGGPGADHLEGDGDGDSILGGAANDHIEGNNGDDTILGEAGDDDLIGGSDTAFGTGDSDDVGEAGVYGGDGSDVIAGDNAVIQSTGYVLGRSVTLLDIGNDGVGGGDSIEGDAATDAIFGQSGDDVIYGDHGVVGPFFNAGAADYIEGNDGNDTIRGETGGDDLVGGSSTGNGDGVVDANRSAAGMDDEGETEISGGPGRDWIAGDNARFDRVLGNGLDYPNPGVTPIQLFDLSTTAVSASAASYGGDNLSGDGDTDIMFGQGGDDVVVGGTENDYVEGNDGDDEIDGGDGTDDLIGGGSAANGLIVQSRTGAGLLDGGETLITGGGGRDSIAGDNARMNRVLFQGPDYPNPAVDPIVLFDLQKAGAPVNDATHGPDVATGGPGTDLMFGQGDDDELWGDGEPDYIEGNDGNDTIVGGDGDDDLVGGGSANDGVIDPVRNGETLHDEGESLIEGNAGVDWIMGDNAISNRVLFNDGVLPIDLFDVNSVDPDVSGGDLIVGGTEDDRLFGQGNGYQGAQSDPVDGIDNDADGVTDEDGAHEAGWLGDTILGEDGHDYIEGNHGSDFILGGAGRDDIAGGGSAIDGVIDADRLGNGLLDGRDTIWGGGDDDVVGGDNVRILPSGSGPLWVANARAVVLFDVNSANVALSGGDFIGGEEGDDVMFGQGNGAQAPTQADPRDSVDNDLDGREGAGSTEYDCYDGFDNDGDGLTDVDGAEGGAVAIDGGCTAGVDEDQPWDGDIIWSGDGVDYAEGNHGADWIFGDAGQDDLIGGGSALNGAITANRSGVGLLDGSDVISGGDGHDVVTGDNATVNKKNVAGAWALIAGGGGGYDLLDRTVAMATTVEGGGQFGNDHLTGDNDHDQLYGQRGNDLIEGNDGDDAVVGDLGTMVASVSAGPAQHIAPQLPFIEDDIFAGGTLNHLTTLYRQETGQGTEGNDIILGGQGHDDLHGGPGNDIMNGDRFDDPPDPDLIDLIPGQFTWDDPAIGQLPFANEDAVFGGWGNDVLWGGRDPDHLYGGRGNDYLDVRPRPAGVVPGSPQDPPSWFTWVRVRNTVTGTYTQEHYQDSDTAYGGWDQDVLQANLADTGPNDGDRLFDWVGAYNLYYICPPVYGDWVATRALAPGMLEYFNNLALGDGLFDPAKSGSSGYSELGLVYTKDVKKNSNPAHPETPGHFYCGPTAP